MAGKLVIVESPAKARAIQKYLGSSYQVLASMGHVMDLSKKKGVQIEKKGKGWIFSSFVEPIKKKEKIIKELRAAAKKAEKIFLAPDPDREGEVIAHHIAEILSTNAEIRRVLFHEITATAVREAFKSPRAIDMKLVESQQARRVLDRIVGFDVSQLLWEKVARGLSAGRVQSVALRLLTEREREIRRFVPVESWSITATLAIRKASFEARLIEIEGKKAEIATEAEAKAILAALEGKPFVLSTLKIAERRRNAVPPFITSTLQQEASRRLGLPVGFTMKIAQKLYEGVELGDEGPTGLITYMRTDSVRVADSAIEEARAHIGKKFGKDYLPESPNRYKTSKAAQDAHEAIRPTSVARTPAAMAKILDAKAAKLYRLIWSRFVASQCTPAIYDTVAADFDADRFRFRANGSTLRFQGFLKVYGDDLAAEKSGEEEGDEAATLPVLKEGDKPACENLTPRQHFTQPPPRFSEAALVKALEEKGIGRPSTYASIIETLKNRQYTFIEKRRLIPTDLGMSVTDLLVAAFPDVFNVDFTAEMENELDEVEEGKRGWQEVLNNFYREFQKDMNGAVKEMPNLKIGIPTEHLCPTCGKVMNLRYGKNGRFIACSGYPDCSTTFEVAEAPDGSLKKVAIPEFEEKCPKCGAAMSFKRSRFGAFLACTQYPECRGIISLKKVAEDQYEVEPVERTSRSCPECDGPMEVRKSRFGRFIACEKYPDKCKGVLPFFIDVPCPVEGCTGELRERQVRGGVVYSCSRFPDCKFRTADRPSAVSCPVCGTPAMAQGKDGLIKCLRPGCDGRLDAPETPEENES
jgi:DNA topoisomerase-1